MKLKLTKDDKKALLIAAIILTVIFTVMHFVLENAPLAVINNPK